MRDLLLDTTVLVDVERGNHLFESLLADDDDVAVSAVSIAELMVGALLASEKQAARRQTFVDRLIEEIYVVSYDLAVAQEHAQLLAYTRRGGTPRGAYDLIIAATGRATGRTVVTSDKRAFVELPEVRVLSYR